MAATGHGKIRNVDEHFHQEQLLQEYSREEQPAVPARPCKVYLESSPSQRQETWPTSVVLSEIKFASASELCILHPANDGSTRSVARVRFLVTTRGVTCLRSTSSPTSIYDDTG